MAVLGKGVEYALHCLLYLSNPPDTHSLAVGDIARFQGVSETYLAKVFTKCAFRPLLPPIPLSKLPPSPAIAATPSERSDAGLGLSVGLGVFGLLWSLQFTHGIACQCQAVGMVHEAI